MIKNDKMFKKIKGDYPFDIIKKLIFRFSKDMVLSLKNQIRKLCQRLVPYLFVWRSL